MNMSEAILELKSGNQVSNGDWSDKELFLHYAKKGIDTDKVMGEGYPDDGFIVVGKVDGEFNIWIPAQNDMLSTNWNVIIPPEPKEKPNLPQENE